MNVVTIGKKKFSLPSAWNEINANQLMMVAQIWGPFFLSGGEVKQEELDAAKMQVLKKLLKMNWFQFYRVKAFEWKELIALLDWIHEEPTLNKQLLPIIKVKGKVFHGPAKELKSSSFDELIFADTQFVNISSKKDWDFIYLLVAALYRPVRADLKEFKASEKWNGDIREPFNAQKVRETSEVFKKRLSFIQALAILYFYWGFRNENLLKFTKLFPKAEEGETKVKESGGNFGWVHTRLDVSNTKFGDFEKTGKESWLNIIFHINEEMKKAEKQQRELERIKNKK